MNKQLFVGTLIIALVLGGMFVFATIHVAQAPSTTTPLLATPDSKSQSTPTTATTQPDTVAPHMVTPSTEQEEKTPAHTATSDTTKTTPPSTNTPTENTSGTYTLADIASHDNSTSCFMAIRGKVYDVTSYIGRHPGGDTILQGCGKDATAMFEGIRGHLKQKTLDLLPGFYKGTLANE